MSRTCFRIGFPRAIVFSISLLLVSACESSPAVEHNFIHVVAPDLLSDADNAARTSAGTVASFQALLQASSHLPGIGDPPEFVVLAGIAPDLVARDSAKGALQALTVAIAGGTVRQLLLVPAGGVVTGGQNLLQGLRDRSAASGVSVHNLTACYAKDELPDSDCTVDLAESSIRLTGFPAFPREGMGITGWAPSVGGWVGRLDSMAARATRAGRVLVVLSDLPDPVVWRELSVPAAAVDRFTSIVASPAVLAVVGMRRAQGGAGPSSRTMAGRLIVTPGLVPQSGDSVGGFTMVRTGLRELVTVGFRRLDGVLAFAPLAPGSVETPRPSVGMPQRIVGWFRGLTLSPDELAFWGILSVALVLAFLTVAQLWSIPDATPGSPVSVQSDGATSEKPTRAQVASVFQSNLGKTVIAGLGGFAVVSFLDDFWTARAFNAKAFYLVAYIVWFFLLLILFALLRAINEGIRHRIATSVMLPLPPRGKENGWDAFKAWFFGRFWLWVLSWRGSFLVFSDTIFNVLQGKNQLQSAAFTETIVNHHLAILKTGGRVRQAIDAEIRRLLNVNTPGTIRVNLTLLNRSGTELFYVSRSDGSLRKPFVSHSIAWLAVATGRPLWWATEYDDTRAILFDNASEEVAGLKAGPIAIKDQFQERSGTDYEAFIVLPWATRGHGGARGAIHISFAHRADMFALFKGLEITDVSEIRKLNPDYGTTKYPMYQQWTKLPDRLAPNQAGQDQPEVVNCLRDLLDESFLVLEAIFAPFDEDFYRNFKDRLCVDR